MVCENPNKVRAGETSNANSLLCIGQASLANRWDTWNIKQNETYSDIFKLKNVCMCVKHVIWLRADCVLNLKQNGWWRGMYYNQQIVRRPGD